MKKTIKRNGNCALAHIMILVSELEEYMKRRRMDLSAENFIRVTGLQPINSESSQQSGELETISRVGALLLLSQLSATVGLWSAVVVITPQSMDYGFGSSSGSRIPFPSPDSPPKVLQRIYQNK
ncbi:hypothetical protein FRC03_003262 [Tulasnella sp. 419]|nr:hypothetical protein FRC03_003262 [Tulasnella sp. 419]